jgi:signal transduction histidine kinase
VPAETERDDRRRPADAARGASGGRLRGAGFLAQLIRCIRRHRQAAASAGVILAVITAVLGGAIAFSLRAIVSVDELRTAMTSAEAQVSATRAALIALLDAESAVRGYVLTRNQVFLVPYEGTGLRLTLALAALRVASADAEPDIQDLVRRLADEAQVRMATIDETLFLLRTRGEAAATQFALDGMGRSSMDAARRDAGTLIERATAERERRAAKLADRESQSQLGLMLTASLGAILLGLAALWLLLARVRLESVQHALRLQSVRLQGTIDQMRDAVAVFDVSGRLLLWNRTFFPRTGLPEHLARSGTPIEAFVAASRQGTHLIEAAEPEAEAHVREVRNGRKMLEVWRSRLPDGGQMVAVADITRRVEAEAVARQGQKMQALGQLTGGVAHDFNNLLHVISANLELLDHRLAGASDLRARVGAAQAGVQRGARLVRHLLAFSRQTPLRPEAVDVAALLRGMEDMLRRLLGEAITIRIVVEEPLWQVRADPHLLETALLNLCINARDAMPQGGWLTVWAQNRAGEGIGHVQISVTDTGVGMSEEQLAHAVEPFYTTKGEGKGTGLGLSMVYGFAQQSGGDLALFSAPGRGTTARLRIPRSAEPAAPAPHPAVPPRGTESDLVLLVETDEAVRTSIAAGLRAAGFQLLEADGAEQALALLGGGAPPAVLLVERGLSGEVPLPAFLERARALHPRLGLVVMGDEGVRLTLPPGVVPVATPWRVEEIARAVRAATPHAARRAVLLGAPGAERQTAADCLALNGWTVETADTPEAALALLPHGADALVLLSLPTGQDAAGVAAALSGQAPTLPLVIAPGLLPAGQVPRNAVPIADPPGEANLRAAMARVPRFA